ncbi:MAG: cation:proton antiporter [Acidimicrobiales bacterium]
MGGELVALGGSFLAAGLLARLGRRAGLPTIPLFMLAGVVFGPHTPGLALVEDPAELALAAELGLVLLLFHLGLEFSLGDLIGGGRKLMLSGAVYLALNVGGGILFGLALGWGGREALVVGGMIGISSSAIVTKLLVELRRLANPETRLILGLIVVEDVFLALYLALLQPVLGDSEGALDAVLAFAKALAFLLALAAVARWGSRVVSRLVGTRDDELLTVLFLGLALLGAGAAEELGVSAAIGAFMIGLILAETAPAERMRRLVLPLRDAFAALFFFAFGLSIEPDDVASVAIPVLAAVVATVALNLTAALFVSRLNRLGRREAANVGLTVLARGEFSLILAALAVAAGLDPRLGPFVAGYVLVLAIAGPLATTHAGRLSRLVPPRLLVTRAPS